MWLDVSECSLLLSPLSPRPAMWPHLGQKSDLNNWLHLCIYRASRPSPKPYCILIYTVYCPMLSTIAYLPTDQLLNIASSPSVDDHPYVQNLLIFVCSFLLSPSKRTRAYRKSRGIVSWGISTISYYRIRLVSLGTSHHGQFPIQR